MKTFAGTTLQRICLLIFLFPWLIAQAQITISQADMPATGDTFRLSLSTSTGGFDPAQTGAGVQWDFSGLTPLSQQTDTFVAVTSTPFTYQIFFNSPIDPHKATMAIRRSLFDIVPGFEVGDVYEFYRSSGQYFGLSGYAGSFSGIPIPVKYNTTDIFYTFPLAYGHTDSSHVNFDFSFPGLGSLYIDKKRVNQVDGWGSLTTPFGTFQTLRVRSTVTEYDSLYLDTLSQGLAIPRNYTEYKWLAQGYGLPLLQITVEGMITTVSYLDSARTTPNGLHENAGRELIKLQVIPNPSEKVPALWLTAAEQEEADLILIDLQGKEVVRLPEKLLSGENLLRLPVSLEALPAGLYFIRLEGARQQWLGKWVKP